MQTVQYSVIVPVYNVEKVLGRCIESILSQTVTNFELILVDDGSTDRSGVICDEYQKKDDRIKVIHKKNGGVSSARNVGLEISQGDYIVFVDSDDFVNATYLESFGTEDEDLVVCGYCIETNGVIGVLTRRPLEKNNIYLEQDELLFYFEKGWFSYIWSKRYRCELIKKNISFDECINMGEDTVFNLQYLHNTNTISFKNIVDYHYIKYENQTLTSMRMDKQFIYNIEKCNYEVEKALRSLVNINIAEIMAKRLGEIYLILLMKIINNTSIDFKNVSYLFRQSGFKNTIKYADKVYCNESKKFRMLLKMKSPILFWSYVKWRNRKKRFLG